MVELVQSKSTRVMDLILHMQMTMVFGVEEFTLLLMQTTVVQVTVIKFLVQILMKYLQPMLLPVMHITLEV